MSDIIDIVNQCLENGQVMFRGKTIDALAARAQELRIENKRLREALEFYADKGNYDDDWAPYTEDGIFHDLDCGDKARAALEPK